MSPARRLAVLAAGALLGLAVAPGASADPEDWSVTDWSGPVASTDGNVTVSGTIHFDPGIAFDRRITQVTLILTRTEPADGCPPATGSQPAYPDDDTAIDPDDLPDPPEEPYDFPFSITVAPRCNGAYTAAVVGTLDGSSPPSGEEDPASDDEDSLPLPQVEGEDEATATPVVHRVSAPPAPVPSVAYYFGRDRVVGLAWPTPGEGYGTASACTATAPTDPVDFTGYVVTRTIGAGTETTLASVPAGEQCYFDPVAADAPLDNYVYRIYATRSGPDGTVRSAQAAATTVVVGPPPTSAPTPTTVRTPGTTRVVSGGDGGTASGTVPPVPQEGTFDEELDYPEPGEAAADAPDDADTFLDFVPSPGPGILVPFAIAECLAVWAFHLRYLARRADDGF